MQTQRDGCSQRALRNDARHSARSDVSPANSVPPPPSSPPSPARVIVPPAPPPRPPPYPGSSRAPHGGTKEEEERDDKNQGRQKKTTARLRCAGIAGAGTARRRTCHAGTRLPACVQTPVFGTDCRDELPTPSPHGVGKIPAEAAGGRRNEANQHAEADGRGVPRPSGLGRSCGRGAVNGRAARAASGTGLGKRVGGVLVDRPTKVPRRAVTSVTEEEGRRRGGELQEEIREPGGKRRGTCKLHTERHLSRDSNPGPLLL
ncbi:uncharacterized protein LOC144932369 [Lampetra fluviatilis]